MFDRIIRLSIGNPVFVNLLFLVICAAGLRSALTLPVEQFPEVSLDRVSVDVIYPGATASDVEELVTKPLEDALEDVADVKEVTSRSAEGTSNVIVTFLEGKDLTEGRSEVEKAVSTVDDLPDDAETPLVRELKLELPVVALGVLGTVTDRRSVDRLVDELRDVDGVASVAVSGLAERRIYVDVDQSKLLTAGLRPEEIAAAISGAKANVPAGSVKRGGSDIFVKTEQRIDGAADVARIPVRPGSNLRVSDLGSVSDAPEELDTEFFVDGVAAVKLTVGREKGADPLGIADEVREMLPRLRTLVPAGVELVVADDYTTAIRDRLRTVGWNALTGALLVIAVLYFLSGARQALLAVWGMPVSYLMATLLMGQVGITVNVISTFGLLIATGIIVDDAIVVIENVQRHIEMGKSRAVAAFDGAKEVLLPVTVAVLTTVFAFMPLTMVGGTLGRVMKILPSVVIFCLLGSLVEALFILPGHLREFASHAAEDSRPARLAARMKAFYRPIVTWVLGRRYIVAFVVFAGFVGAVALAIAMPKQFGAPGKPFELNVVYELSPGVSKVATRAQGEEILAQVAGALPDDAVQTSTLRVGRTRDQRSGIVQTGSNRASIRWEFNFSDAYLAAYPHMIKGLRASLIENPDLAEFTLQEVQAGPPAGAAVTARVRGRDIAAVNEVVFDLKKRLRDDIKGLTDIRDDYGSGKETFRIRVDQDRAALYGLTEVEVGRAVRTAVDGLVALELSIEEDPVEVVVRYEGSRAMSRSELGDLLILNRAGKIVRVDQVADVQRTREVGLIRREDGQRTVSILTDVIEGQNTSIEASNQIQDLWEDDFADRYPDITLSFGGEADEFRESLADLPAAFALAVALIYTALALQFGSYLQPFIILSAVPFGVMGAVYGLFVMGFNLSMFALFGIVALAGICVNDSLVMVDFINRLRDEGMPAREAAVEGAVNRLRPIVSTTLTTCLGLAPLAIGLGGQDLILAPMAVSIAAGLGVATSLILLAVPALYMIFEDVHHLLVRVFRLTPRRGAEEE